MGPAFLGSLRADFPVARRVMYSLFVALDRCILSLFLSPLVRNAVRRLGLEQPDHQRKLHNVAFPSSAPQPFRLGHRRLRPSARRKAPIGAMASSTLPFALRVLPARVFAIVVIDDFHSVRPSLRVSALVLATLHAWYGGIVYEAAMRTRTAFDQNFERRIAVPGIASVALNRQCEPSLERAECIL